MLFLIVLPTYQSTLCYKPEDHTMTYGNTKYQFLKAEIPLYVQQFYILTNGLVFLELGINTRRSTPVNHFKNITITISDIIRCPNFLFKAQCFEGWIILSLSSGRTYSVGPNR
jgi:hypothetical protein